MFIHMIDRKIWRSSPINQDDKRGGKQEEMSVALHEEPINISQVQESVKGKIHSSLVGKATKTLTMDESDSHK